MTRLEMQFMEQVPVLLRNIHKELKRLNDNLDRAAGAEPAQKKESAKEGWPYRLPAETPIQEVFPETYSAYSRRIVGIMNENNIKTLGDLYNAQKPWKENACMTMRGIGKATFQIIRDRLNTLRKTPLPG